MKPTFQVTVSDKDDRYKICFNFEKINKILNVWGKLILTKTFYECDDCFDFFFEQAPIFRKKFSKDVFFTVSALVNGLLYDTCCIYASTKDNFINCVTGRFLFRLVVLPTLFYEHSQDSVSFEARIYERDKPLSLVELSAYQLYKNGNLKNLRGDIPALLYFEIEEIFSRFWRKLPDVPDV